MDSFGLIDPTKSKGVTIAVEGDAQLTELEWSVFGSLLRHAMAESGHGTDHRLSFSAIKRDGHDESDVRTIIGRVFKAHLTLEGDAAGGAGRQRVIPVFTYFHINTDDENDEAESLDYTIQPHAMGVLSSLVEAGALLLPYHEH